MLECTITSWNPDGIIHIDPRVIMSNRHSPIFIQKTDDTCSFLFLVAFLGYFTCFCHFPRIIIAAYWINPTKTSPFQSLSFFLDTLSLMLLNNTLLGLVPRIFF